ncbi:MAG: Hpt domain-containing protein [Sporichthyaceae bacterium]|nr:Hpt domain-containing protein [Sporichthyaceae bacterium]
MPEEQGDDELPAKPEDALVIDRGVLQQLRAELEDDEIVDSVLDSYLAELPGRLRALHDAVDRHDVRALSASAHLLKGASALIGAQGLVKHCQQLELIAHSGSLEGAADVCAAASAEADRVVALSPRLRSAPSQNLHSKPPLV